MEQILQAFESNPITATILSTLLVIIGIYISYNRFIVADKSFKLAKSNFENSQSNFNIYLESCFRANLKANDIRKILLFNIRINNLSTSKNTFTPSLEIEYIDEDNQRNIVKLKHQPKLKNEIPENNFSIMDANVRIEEKDIKSGWVIFEQPKALNTRRIEKYSVIIKDSHKNNAVIEAYLIKDIIHETKV